jgi:hypothetical protein
MAHERFACILPAMSGDTLAEPTGRVSSKHLQLYLDENVFRYNNRGDERGLFMAFLDRIEKASPDPSVPS